VEGWFGLVPTGRQLREPTGQLVELVDAQGVVCLGIQFDPAWCGHPTLVKPVSLVRSFLEYPMVVGLVELLHGDAQTGRFVYPTGPILSVKELLRAHSDLGRPPGARAALELLYLAGQILTEGAATGGMQGCFSHGGLTPWRITVRDDAHVQVVGYGLPSLDVLAWRADPTALPHADSVRYAPPERLTGLPEDEAADTAALVAIGYELVTGQPLYPGHDVLEVARSVSISEAVPMLSRPNALPRDIAQVFARSVVFDPDSRLRGDAWVQEIATLLEAHSTGDGLEAAVARVRDSSIEGARRARIQQAHETAAHAPAALAALARAPEPAPAPAPASMSTPRWQKVERSRPVSPASTPSPSFAHGETPVRRRRRGPLELQVQEEENESGGELPLLDLDELDDGDDLLLEPVDPVPSRPRLRRRPDEREGGSPLAAPSRHATATPAGPPRAEPGPGGGRAEDPTTGGLTTRRRRRLDP
jgi:hypothetical protein